MKTIPCFKARLTAAFALVVLTVASAISAEAGTDTWTGGTSGVWQTSPNWNSGSGPAPSTTDTAYFNGTGGGTNTLTFSGAASLDNITFDVGASSYTIGTIGGSTLTLTSGGTIQTTAADTNAQTINEPISLGGNYTFASNSTVSTNAILKFGGTIALGANTLTLAGSNTGSNAISGVISGTGGITMNGTGDWTLTGVNTYTGTTAVQNGTLIARGGSIVGPVVLGNGANSGILQLGNSSGNGNITVTGLSTSGTGTANAVVNGYSSLSALKVTLASGTTNTFAGTLGGGGAGATTANDFEMILNGQGTLILTGINNYTGTTAVQSGTLIARGGSISASAVVLGSGTNSGILQLGNSGGNGNITVTGLSTSGTGTANAVVNGYSSLSDLTVNLASGTETFGGTLGGGNTTSNDFELSLTGQGTLILTGTNTYTGGTLIGSVAGNGGTLQVNGNTTSNSLASGGAFSFGGGTFDYNNSNASGTNAQTIGVVSLSSGANTIKNVETGAGTSTLTGTFNAPAVGATVNFVTTSNSTIIAATGLALNANMFYNGQYAYATTNVAIGAVAYGTTSNSVIISTSTAFAPGNNANLITYNGTAQDSGGSGGSGTIAWVAADGSANNSTLNVTGYGFIGGFLVNGGSSGYSETITASALSDTLKGPNSGAVTFMTSGTNDTLTVSAPIANFNTTASYSGVLKTGLGTLFLTGSNTYSGATYVDQGTLETTVNNNSTGGGLGFGGITGKLNYSPGTAIVYSGATLDLASTAANTTIDEAITLAGGNLSNTSTANTATLDNGVAGVKLTNAGTSGSATSGTVSFSTGTTQAAASVVVTTGEVSSIQTTAAGSGYTSAPTVTISITGDTNAAATAVLSSLTLDGTANTIGGTGNITINAVIADGTTSGGFTKTGADTLDLTGANTYTGATSVSAGTLELSGSLGGTAVTVSNGATLAVNDGGTIGTGSSGSLTINDGGIINLQGGGAGNTLNLNGSGTTLTLGSGSGATTLKFDVGSTADEISLGSGNTVSMGSETEDVYINGLGSLNGATQTLISAPGGGLATSASDYVLETPTGTLNGYTLSLDPTSTALLLKENSPTPTVDYWTGATNASWATYANFSTTSGTNTPATGVPGPVTDVVFGTSNPTPANLNTTLDAATTINSLTFNTSSNVTIGAGSGGSLTLEAAITSTNGGINSAPNGIMVNSGAGAVTISAPVTLGANQIWTNSSTNTLTVSGVVSGSNALTKAGNGTLVLSGANTYTGATTVYSGTLQVSGSTYHLGQVTVDGGATLSGTGSVGNVTLNAGGTINLQDGAIDSLTVNSLVLGGGLTSLIDLDIQTSGSTTTVDSIDDTGSLTLNPFATINIGNLVGTTNLTDGTYTLISDTSLTGSDSLTNDTNTVNDLTLRGTAEGDGQTLSLIEGTNDSIDLDVTAPTQYTINTTTLNSYAGNSNHPRLIFNKGTGAGSISALQSNIENNQSGVPRWGEMWSGFKFAADFVATQAPLNYFSTNSYPDDYPTVANDPQLWQRAVGDNMAILAMAYVLTSTNTATSTDTIWLEAEETPVNSPMTVATTTSTNVSCGAYIGTTNTVATNTNDMLLPPSASYYFSNHNTGAYYVWARVNVPSSTANSWFFNIDGPTGTSTNVNYNHNATNYFSVTSTNTPGNWAWVESGPFYLTPGNHVMNLTYQAGGVEFDKFAITTNSNLNPSGFGIEQHWLEAKNFTITTTNLLVTTSNTLETFGDAMSLTQQWLEAPRTITSTNTDPTTPDASQTISVNGGSYDIWARIKAPYEGTGSFWFEINTGGYSNVTMESTNTAFPYNPLINPKYFIYNETLSSPYNGYAYREWVWVKAASSVSFPTPTNVTLNVCNEDASDMWTSNDSYGADVQIDRFVVQPANTAAPTDPNKYLAAAQQWANASCNYPTWGIGTQAQDLAAETQLEGLGYLYDWCYGSLGATDLTTISSTLSVQGTNMYTAASTAYSQGGAWWGTAYLMNHLWEDTTGLTTAALAIYGDTSPIGTNTLPTEAIEQNWLNKALGDLSNTMTNLEGDGADHEGVEYYEYGGEHLLKYLSLADKLMGVNMYSTPWFEQSATYRLYFDLPANYQSTTMSQINIGDDVGEGGSDYLFRELANLYNVPTAQWQAEHYDVTDYVPSGHSGGINSWAGIDGVQGGSGTSPWLNLLWYNPGVPETPPATAGPDGGSIPTLGYFSDLDFVVSRSGWTGTDSVVAYQCGPMMGHGVQAKNKTNPYVDWGSNHVHPSASNFCLFGGGSWLILNAGYDGVSNHSDTPFKITSQDNTLVINNAGQLGESTNSITFNGSAAKGEDPGGVLNPAVDDTLSYSTAEMDYIVGNATACYPAADGLTKYRRHLLYLKPSDVLVVVDDVATTSNDTLQLNFHPQNVQPVFLGADSYSTTTNGAQLYFSVLTTSNSTLTSNDVPWLAGAGNHWTYEVSPKNGSTNSWSDAVAMAWSTTNTTPTSVTMITDPDDTAWKFKVGTETMVLDRNVTSYAPDEIARAVTTLEAESGTLSSQMVIGDTNTASQDEYITTVSGLSLNNPNTLTSPSASYTFNAPVAGTYAIWARVLAANASSNSFWYAVNPGAGSTYTNSVSTPTYGNWVWVELTPSASLTAGTNTLGIQYEAPNCCIDQIIITGDTLYTPTYEY